MSKRKIQKIAIIGNAGTGKTTLAIELHKKTGFPLYHLDHYFWKPGWVEPDRAEFEKIHNALCDKEYGLPADCVRRSSSAKVEALCEGWIIEGMAIRFAEYRFAKADVIIFLDIPRYCCFWRIFKRTYKNWGKEHCAPGCPERGPTLKFLRFVWNFNYGHRDKILQLLEKYADAKKVYIFNTTDNIIANIYL